MMKKFFLIITLFCTQLSFAKTDLSGLFHLDVSANAFSVSSVTQHFADYLDLPANTTFDLFRNETDTAGWQHLSYQQKVEGVEVDGAMILVHAQGGLVKTMNGEVLSRVQSANISSAGSPVSARAALSKVGQPHSDASHAKIVIVKVLEGDKYVYHKAYRIKAANFSKYEYVDVQTGEIIKEKSLVFSADVQGTAHTMYNGVVPFTCYQHTDGYYYLHDEGRNFTTLDATNATPIDYDNAADPDSALRAYRQTCSSIAHTSTDWDLSYHRYLKQINVIALPAWNPQVGDSLPDLYINVYSSSNQLLYSSAHYDDAVCPVGFSIPDGIEAHDGALKVYLYDYDPVGEDNYICDFHIPAYLSSVDISITVSDTISVSVRFEENGCQPALDVHWGMQKTIDFYRSTFNRNGHDNQGGELYQFYNPQPDKLLFSTMPGNAFANYGIHPNFMAYGSGLIVYGDTAHSMNPVVDLDVMAHEYTHLVTAHNGNGGLTYEDESGALNESFSDLMAMGVVKYTKGTCSWQLGQNTMVYAPNMRSLSNPYLSGGKPQPCYYEGRYWATLGDYSMTGDQGGVHTNSGVQNYWFYLLCEGGTGTNENGDYFNISGIGLDKGLQIVYLNLLYYLTPNASYLDARWGSEQAAKELYGENSSEYNAVVGAWDAVGVVDSFVPTEVDNTLLLHNATKCIIDGHLFILRDGRRYTILGSQN